MNLELEGKVFFVTGAANGIGAAATKILLESGAKVAACDRDAARLEEMYKGTAAVLTTPADISQQKEIQGAIDACQKKFGRVDSLLHFAAVLDRHNLDELTPEIWDSVMSVNLRGSYLVVQAVVKHMRAQGGGHIVLTASDSARMGSLVSGPAYAASKGGVIALTHTLALYLGPSKIKVNAVCPGLAMTGMSAGWDQNFIDGIAKRTPLGRLAQPEDVAKVAIFLGSSGAGFMTGEVVEVNGGIHFD
jgi:NAD(P)-dependent dehydrogenase (short-subunit alcohol dehydrogenase family)